MPRVSVLMPAYNSEKYIATAIQSILNQSFADFEFIIVDDASTDKTFEIITQLAATDSRIVMMRNESNQGISKNRNKLISLARGEFIAWQDSDDIAKPDRIAKQVAFMEQHSRVGICGGYVEFFNDRVGHRSIRKYDETDKDLRKKIFRFSPVAQPAAMIRKEVFTTVGNYNEDLAVAEDIDMSFRIGTNYKFGNVPDVVLEYRQHQSSATFKKLKNMEKITLNVRRKFSKNGAYHVSPVDILYNVVQFLTLYIFPATIRVKLFNFLRNE